MKHSNFFLSALLFSFATSSHAGTFIPAENESYSTEDVRKITFAGDNIEVEWTDKANSQYEFSSLQRIVFSEGDATNSELFVAEKGLDLYLYPNPVVETLYLEGVPAGTEVLMYAAGGTTVGIFHSNGTTLQANIGNIKNGIYFLKIGKKVVKFIKK